MAMDSTGKTTEPPQLPPPQAASPALISAVLGNDDLLREILLRLDFPTCLVRAAAVSRRWLRHASDPAFLRRLHPPRLGFYLDTSEFGLRFIPLPQPPELAAVIHRGKFDLGRGARHVLDCRNALLIVSTLGRKIVSVCRPLHPGRGAKAILELTPVYDFNFIIFSHDFLFHDGGGDDMVEVAVICNRSQAWFQTQEFRAGNWGEARNLDLIQLPGQLKRFRNLNLLANGKIYMICMPDYILGLDVQSMSWFSIKLPNGLEFEYANTALSRAEGSEFYLIHVRRFQLCVWRYTMDHSSNGHWELIDTISLRQVFGPNADPTWWSQGADVEVVVVGDNADFVFFRIHKKVFYFHISSRTMEKVYELGQFEPLLGVSPLMMVWLPTFPIFHGGHDKDE